MGVRDRFYTATTAKALLSWRLLAGGAVAVVLALLSVNPVVASLVGLGTYAALVYLAMPKDRTAPRVDAFTLSEPWRHYVQSASRSRNALGATVKGVKEGPIRDRLNGIVERLEQATEETDAIAKRGDEIDDAINRIDPVRLRSRLETLKTHAGGNVAAATESVESQLASADRLKVLSAQAADQLRLTNARLDELVARAAEVSVGSGNTDEYARDVDDLVIELEALRQAVAETEQTG